MRSVARRAVGSSTVSVRCKWRQPRATARRWSTRDGALDLTGASSLPKELSAIVATVSLRAPRPRGLSPQLRVLPEALRALTALELLESAGICSKPCRRGCCASAPGWRCSRRAIRCASSCQRPTNRQNSSKTPASRPTRARSSATARPSGRATCRPTRCAGSGRTSCARTATRGSSCAVPSRPTSCRDASAAAGSCRRSRSSRCAVASPSARCARGVERGRQQRPVSYGRKAAWRR